MPYLISYPLKLSRIPWRIIQKESMRKFIPTLLTIMALLFVTAPVWADKKKGQKVDPRPYLPEPDEHPAILKPQESLSPLPPLRIPEAPSVVTEHHASGRGGIDVSHYQGHIDWKAVHATGKVLYAYVKATESTSLVDNTYSYNIKQARAAGIPVGCYHFFSPSTDGSAQLKNFINTVNLNGHDLVPMVDVELRGKSPLPQFITNLRTFIQGIEKHYHVKPILYTSVNFYNKYLAGHFDDYVYMIARYAEEIPQPEKGCRFGLWQYSATGRVNGIRGAVDCSCFVDSYELKDIMIKK